MIVNSKHEKELGLWRLTGVGSYVADASAIKAQGGSRKVYLPNSSLRVADLSWDPLKDVNGKIVCWRRNVAGVPVLILNNSREEEMTKTAKETTPEVPEKVEPKAPKLIAYEPK